MDNSKITRKNLKKKRKTLLSLYKSMLLTRKTEEALINFHPEQKMKTPFHLYIGQEAIATGICNGMKKKDLVFSYHRGHGHYLAKQGNLKSFFCEMYNKENGCSSGRGGSMHLIDTSVGHMGSSSIVGGTVPIAVGAALALKKKKKTNVVAVFFGDGTVDEGVVYESFNFAALHKLNIIFICEDNELSVSTPKNLRRAKDNMIQKARSFGLKAKKLNGNNVLDIYNHYTQIRKIQKKTPGPFFLECNTYRIYGHIGINNDLIKKIRTKSKIKKWKKKCPLKIFESFLIKNHIISKQKIEIINNNIKKKILLADNLARRSPLPNKKDLLKYVYS